jgi:hypothetical protein
MFICFNLQSLLYNYYFFQFFKSQYMLKLAPVFLVLTIGFSVYTMTSAALLPKMLLFSSVVLLCISLLGKKRIA